MTNTTENKFKLSNIVDELIVQRQKWEQGTYAASNAELYTLLGNTLELFLKVRSNVGLSKAVTDLLNTYSIQHNSSTSLALKIVRLVFVGKGREKKIENRAYTYARVLTVAAEAGITGEQLPQFIADNHGIDELRRQNKDGETDAEKAKRARDYADAALVSETAISDVIMSDSLQPVDGARYSLALVRKNEDGSGSIVFGTSNVTAVNTVLTIAGKALKDRAVQTAEQNVEKHDAEQRAENAERLTQELLNAGFQSQAHVAAPIAEMAPV
jgi:nitrogen regulatory protein PII-like uncharacterized protein